MRYLLAIPVYNESRYIRSVIEQVTSHTRDILVVDDGSTDDTPRLLDSWPQLARLTHPENRGYGQSLIDAFRFAHCRGYDWVITMDCDAQHEPEQIPAFVDAARRDRADVISGSRYLHRHPEDNPPPEDRRRVNHVIADLLQQLLGLKLTDAFCGFKAHRVAAMNRLRLDEPGYAFPLQFWVQCVRAGLRVEEIPVRRIYLDASREFGGTLDDPAARLQHYLHVLMNELQREPQVQGAARAAESGCFCDER
jgi:dolichol-phosphate mannosyltransferase